MSFVFFLKNGVLCHPYAVKWKYIQHLKWFAWRQVDNGLGASISSTTNMSEKFLNVNFLRQYLLEPINKHAI
jgi:hypothetical protein